jgi:hypothetical protein
VKRYASELGVTLVVELYISFSFQIARSKRNESNTTKLYLIYQSVGEAKAPCDGQSSAGSDNPREGGSEDEQQSKATYIYGDGKYGEGQSMSR